MEGLWCIFTPSHSLHGEWAFRIIGRRLTFINRLVDYLEAHDYPCRGEYYPYKALQFGYIVFGDYGCDSVMAMYLHCIMDSIYSYLEFKNRGLREKGYFTLNNMKCMPVSKLEEDKWLWKCTPKDNPYLGMTLTQEQLDEMLVKAVRDRVERLLNEYLEAVKKVKGLIEKEEKISLPRELLKDMEAIASNREFIRCASKSLIELKRKLSSESLFRELAEDIAREVLSKARS